MNTTPIVGMWGLLAAVEATIKAAPPAQRGELAAVLDAYARDFPEEFSWATSPQAPALLYHLMLSIDLASDPVPRSRPWFLDTNPEGTA
jgi:hypothetical protein